MKKIAPKINFNKKDFKRVLFKIFCFKRLLFMVFFGALLIFTFNTIYKYTFLNIKYIDYAGDDSFIIIDGKIANVSLSRILKNIEEDKKRVKIGINKEHKSPFEFEYEIEYDNENEDYDENIDRDDLDNSENSEDDENSESNDVAPFEL